MSARAIKGSRKDYQLIIDATTSTLIDHNSFDYETTTTELNPVISCRHAFSLSHKFIYILRNETTFVLTFQQHPSLSCPPLAGLQLLGVFEIRYIDFNIILRFYEPEDLLNDARYGTQNRKSIANEGVHHIYVVVRSLKNEQNESSGYRLMEGSLLKIGQKEYFVSSVGGVEGKEGVGEKLLLVDSIVNSHRRLVVDEGKTEGECKYCMMEEGEADGEFLCSPCKCSGSCAAVHFTCLERWNQSKVKKSQVKGLTYYNFDKFFCEVCKEEYPKFIDKGGKTFELMPIDLPKGQHLILQQIDLHSSSLICIENIPEEGIRMGRGNECEIRVDSPSISRNHARIALKEGQYYVYDNKSKFGTVVRDNKIYLQVGLTRKGVQIDRTVLMFSLAPRQLLL